MAEQRPAPINLLLIEDSPDDAELVVMELRRGGYDPSYKRVDTAAQMREALKERRWDMILCDYTMPNFNISAALDVVREHGLDTPLSLHRPISLTKPQLPRSRAVRVSSS